MRHIIVDVQNKIATAQGNALYVCGNSDYIIRFSFDDDWDGLEAKTARFEYEGTYQDVVFAGNECNVPIISDVYSFNVGVYAGDLRTTTPAYIPARKSILCSGGVPAEPMPDVYNQIVELVNKACVASDEAVKQSGESAVEAAEHADRAEMAASQAGWFDMEVNEAGHLVYTRSETVDDIDFDMQEGRLLVTYG